MLQLGIYLSIAIIACSLYGAQGKSLEGDISTIVRQTPPNDLLLNMLPLLDHIAKQSKCNIADDLHKTHMATQKDNEEKLIAMQSQQADIQKSLESQLETQINLKKDQRSLMETLKKMETQQAALVGTLSEIYTKVFWPKFKQIGSRLFYIDSSSKYTWEGAVKACRQLGGYIAAIRDQEELDAITEELDDKRYWLGINDRTEWGDYVSEASGKNDPFLKWRHGEPNKQEDNEHCVEIDNSVMNDEPCSMTRHLICQSDKEV
ncbi:accessory gland protein Acp29AB-like [Drosophila takahashii]|uniref:accessory gland protein Acp29AB-like n=1 Tax=Drosophila takahashii TaxID=29030 RepID=UPI003898E232